MIWNQWKNSELREAGCADTATRTLNTLVVVGLVRAGVFLGQMMGVTTPTGNKKIHEITSLFKVPSCACESPHAILKD